MNASLTMAEVLSIVAPAFELTPQELRGRRQTIAVCTARTVFIAMAAEFTPRSDSEIALFLGRDLATVVEAQKRHARALKLNPPYKPRIWDIQQRLAALRDALNPAEDAALLAARRVLAGGAALGADEIQAVCSRLIQVELQFQELAFFTTELSHG